MELPKRLSPPEGCAWNEESPHFKINEIISYLESQKEGEDDCLCHLGEPPKKGCINYKEELKCSCAIDNVGGNCKWCREEPKECKHGKAYICAECNDKFSPVKEEPKCEHNYLLRKDLKTVCVDCGEEPKQIDVEETKVDSIGGDECYCEWFKCEKCGDSMITDESNYCPNCGRRIIKQALQQHENN